MTHYAQGCDGGFGYLVAKWAADFTIVANKGFPYESGLSDSFGPPCSKKCTDCEQDKYRATNVKYIGGYFGSPHQDFLRLRPWSQQMLCGQATVPRWR